MHEKGERCALRPGNLHSADGWEEVLKPVMARYADRHLMQVFRADAAFAISKLYKTLEAEEYYYAIRLGTNCVLQGRIAHLLKRPVGRPPKGVKRIYGDFEYQAASWDKPRREVAKVEWHRGELIPRVAYVVTNMPMEPDGIVRFNNQRGTAEQHIKEGRQSIGPGCPAWAWPKTKSTCNFTRWPTISASSCKALICLQTWLIKIGARVARRARAITFQLAEVAVSGDLFNRILAAIQRLRAPPAPS